MFQRLLAYLAFVHRAIQPLGDVVETGQRAVRIGQLVLARLEFLVEVDRLLVDRDQQVHDLLALGGDEMPLPAEMDFHPHLHLLALAHFLVHQQVIDAGQQVFLVVWFADEVVGAALQPFHDVQHVRQRGHQDDRYVLHRVIGLDRLAQFIAVHLGHHDCR